LELHVIQSKDSLEEIHEFIGEYFGMKMRITRLPLSVFEQYEVRPVEHKFIPQIWSYRVVAKNGKHSLGKAQLLLWENNMEQKKESLGKRNVSDMTLDEQISLAKELKNEFTKRGARIFNSNDYRLPNGGIDSTRLVEDIVDDLSEFEEEIKNLSVWDEPFDPSEGIVKMLTTREEKEK